MCSDCEVFESKGVRIKKYQCKGYSISMKGIMVEVKRLAAKSNTPANEFTGSLSQDEFPYKDSDINVEQMIQDQLQEVTIAMMTVAMMSSHDFKIIKCLEFVILFQLFIQYLFSYIG